MDKIELLSALADEIRVCPLCRLADTRTLAVPGEGNPQAQIMFVGEGPGEQEDQTGRPFVGRSGKLLTQELVKIGIRREQIFITNIVKCRPPGNRDPLGDEIVACNDWLSAQIALIEPKFIVPVGGPSLKTLVSPKLGIMKARSKVYRKDGILFIPILHPAAALRSPTTMQQFLEDLANLKDFLNRDIEDNEITPIEEPKAAPASAKDEEDGGTLSLF
ncbi:type-4 uracil-DNA glycosylase [Abditibacteriota bacterium]|nr:type-4 uracil-DNA glycosylase [Abditibacteriota bacterium]